MHVVFSRQSIFALIGLAVGRAILPFPLQDKRIGAAKTRDADAFADLMKVHAEPLRRFIARRVRSDDREDLFQDTSLAVWESLPSFNAQGNFRAWIYSICFHKIQDYWRKEQYRPPCLDLSDNEGLLTYLPSEYGAIEIQATLADFWQNCTADQKELLRLYYSDGLTLKEISIVLRRNLNTVKYQFYRVHDLAVEQMPNDLPTTIAGGASK
jgi:RNA polymerase sigma-70 factor (ECF subfamily)